MAHSHFNSEPSSAHSSTSSVRLAARIKRDAPEIAKRVEAGEFKSMRAAAVEAGIIKTVSEVDKTRKALEKLPRAVALAVIADYLGCGVDTLRRTPHE